MNPFAKKTNQQKQGNFNNNNNNNNNQNSQGKKNYPEDPLLKVDILEVLNAMGAMERANDGSKWKVPNLGMVIVRPGTQAFMLPFMGDISGYGGLDFVKKALSLEFKDALAWLRENLPDNPNTFTEDGIALSNNKFFTPPIPYNPNKDKVKDYLVNTRGLPVKLIDQLMEDGSIYADKKCRCVFISDSGAEVRSAYESETKFKGGVDGNDPTLNDFGFQVEANTNAILRALSEKKQAPAVGVAEAAITGLSYHVLNPHTVVLSSNGAGRFQLHFSAAIDTYFNDTVPFEMPFHMAMDADKAGDFAAQRVWNALYLRERLSSGLDIDIEEIDQWIKNKDLIIDLRSDVTLENGVTRKMMVPSPHLCFFGLDLIDPNVYPDNLKVLTLAPHTKINDEHDDEEDELPVIDTGTFSPPVVSFTVSKGLHPKLNRTEYRNIPVDKVNYDKVSWCLRARPKFGKDWNDELKYLGAKAHQEYLRKIAPMPTANATKKMKLK
jgi:hypothetical protein